MGRISGDQSLNEPLVVGEEYSPTNGTRNYEENEGKDLKSRVWIESKKLWHIVGPSIFSRVATYTMNIVSQAFAGHLGDLELASFSIANNVLIGFNFGLLLGMASALETLCGQAFGAKRYRMLGIYMQRSWIVLFFCCFFLLPLYIFATPILKLLGQTDEVAEQAGLVSLWLIPLHFSFAFMFPVQRFLQSQLRTQILAWVSFGALIIHVALSWLFYALGFGVVGLSVALDLSWWINFFGLFGYTVWGGCPDTWVGFSMEAFSGLWEFIKLSAASGVMLCLENWYYRILILMTGNLKDATIAVDALSVCVRVANELGAQNGKAAKFATLVSVVQSSIIGLVFCVLIVVFCNQFISIFTTSSDVLEAVDKLKVLLAATILLNSVQPVLSGVAVGSGWQSKVAYLNLGCYYVVGIPLGVVFGWVFNWGVEGIWAGMIFGGTAVQTIILGIITYRCNWEKQAKKATDHIEKWSSPNPDIS